MRNVERLRIKARWQFFKSRYRSNMQYPEPMTPELRFRRGGICFAIWLFLAVAWLLLATVGGQIFGWLMVVPAGFLAVSYFRVMRTAHLEQFQPREPRD
jgi:fatty acid desaturase